MRSVFQTPSHALFAKVYQRDSEMGTFTASRPHCGVPRRRRAPELEEANYIQWKRMRRVARRLNVDQKTVCVSLHNQQLHPYHPQRVQAFLPRVKFYRWFLHHCVAQPDFPWRILFTNEAKFSREGVVNFRNGHVCADENPCATRPHGF